jgi:hypothetical protein
MSNGSRTEGLVQRVPHLWYDIIGRVIPGAFLLGGLFDASVFAGKMNRFRCYFKPDSIVGLTVGLSVFIGLAFTAGFLLGAAAGLLEGFWSALRPFNLDQDLFKAIPKDILKEYGVEALSNEPADDPKIKCERSRQIVRAGSAILHILWTHPEGVAIAELTSKRDAEKLASSSLAFAALILLAINISTGKCRQLPCYFVITLVLVLLVVIILYLMRIPEKFNPDKQIRSVFVIASLCLVICSTHVAEDGRCWLFLAIILASLASYSHYRERCLETPLSVIGEMRRWRNSSRSNHL